MIKSHILQPNQSQRYMWILEYDGSGYHGWNIQPDRVTIQSVFEEALSKAANCDVRTHAASRTDAGVSARAQVVHADLPTTYPISQLTMGVQAQLKNHKISVLAAHKVQNNFIARKTAGKTYSYTIMNRSTPPAIDKAMWVRSPLNISDMENASQMLIGTHDFSSFQSANCCSKNKIRTIHSIAITHHEDLLKIMTTGTSFLMHQVRIIVGTLVQVGRGHLTHTDLQSILAARNRAKNPAPTAPPEPLCLEEIFYHDMPKFLIT